MPLIKYRWLYSVVLCKYVFPNLGNGVESLISEVSVDQGLGASRQFRKKPIQKGMYTIIT